MSTYKVTVSYDGTTHWYNEDGELHREDGPAVVWKNGSKYWYLNGKCHREDGPAAEYVNGEKQWWLDHIEYTEDGFNAEILKRKSPLAGRVVEVEGFCYTLVPTGEVK